ncbi:MAG TPA: permease [Pseudomonadota bacterium]|nr:permease [Pseudomonadota bacterium]
MRFPHAARDGDGVMKLLLLSTVALFLGPLFSRVLLRAAFALAALDGFVLLLVLGIVLGMLLPQAHEAIGWPALPLAVAGYLFVRQIERLHDRKGAYTHRVVTLLGLFGFATHEFLDGVALAMGQGEHGAEPLLPLAIVLHRIPIGLSIFWLLRKSGAWAGLAALGFVAISTALGFAFSAQLFAHADSSAVGVFQSVVAGALLHVVIHEEEGRHGKHVAWEGLGGLLGLLVLCFQHSQLLPLARAGEASMARTLFLLAQDSAPALLVAYVTAGLIGVFLPAAGVAWLSRGNKFVSAIRGVLFGLPLPICSCGVLPVYRSLILKGTPPAAALSFLVAAPELGLDSVLLSFPLLGARLTLARIVCAFAVAILAGVVVSSFLQKGATMDATPLPSEPPPENLWEKLRRVYQIGFVDTVDHTAPWIVLGLGIAAALEPLLRIEWVMKLPKGLDVPLLALLGLPMYVCASSATPLVAVLIHKGISPGAAVAFLLTGPATNATTYGILSQLHGRRIALLYGSVIAALTIASGFLINRFVSAGSRYPFHEGATHAGWIHTLCLGGLLLLFVTSFLRQGPRGFLRELASSLALGHSGSHSHAHHAPDTPQACHEKHDHKHDHKHHHDHGTCNHSH